jgi:hypothetical protein
MPMAQTASDAVGIPACNARGWRDELWTVLIGALDRALRSHYNIIEFVDDPTCVLRIGRAVAERPVLLSDGIQIRAGETIGTLHFWNEHLLPFARAEGPCVHWAIDMHRRVSCSFAMLADFVESDPDWRDVRAFRGEAALSSRIGDTQLRRVAHHYGLEHIAAPQSVLRQLHELGECFSAWGLTRAYNSAALPRQRFFRRHQEIWISRAALVAHPAARSEREGRARGEVARCPPL